MGEGKDLNQPYILPDKVVKVYKITEVKIIIENSDFKNLEDKTNNPDILSFLKHYTITRDDVNEEDKEVEKIRKRYNNLIKKDKFVNLTLTYDFE